MPRRARSIVGGYACHVLNRANGRLRRFRKDVDLEAFERTLLEALDHVPLRITGTGHWPPRQVLCVSAFQIRN